MRKLSNREISNLVILEIMAPYDPESSPLSEETRREIHNRWDAETSDEEGHKYNWRFILDPIEDEHIKKKYIELLEYIQESKE